MFYLPVQQCSTIEVNISQVGWKNTIIEYKIKQLFTSFQSYWLVAKFTEEKL